MLIVKCIVAGRGFEKGKLYPVTGWNNGIHITRCNKEGDAETLLFQTGGIGEGLFNPFECDREEYGPGPSFDEYMKIMEE